MVALSYIEALKLVVFKQDRNKVLSKLVEQKCFLSNLKMIIVLKKPCSIGQQKSITHREKMGQPFPIYLTAIS